MSEGDGFELSWLRGEIEGHKGNPKKAEELELEAKLKSVTAAQYLVNQIKRENSVGYERPTDLIDRFFEDLTAMGVALSGKKQVETLMQALVEMCNHQHLWCNHGWTPNELSARMRDSGKPTIRFGPGMQKAFADGSMDKDEIVRTLKQMGLKIE